MEVCGKTVTGLGPANVTVKGEHTRAVIKSHAREQANNKISVFSTHPRPAVL